jgi:hydrogenase/urease accessory protein HupE
MNRRLPVLVAILTLFGWAWWDCAVSAHEIRPAYLQVREVAPDTYDVLWKVPRSDESVLDIAPRFAAGFDLRPVGDGTIIEGFVVYRYRLVGHRPLPGTSVSITGLERSTIDTLAVLTLRDGREYSYLLQPTRTSVLIEPDPSAWSVVRTYVQLGVEHILLGIDHLLFVLALIIITTGVSRIVKTITAFTCAHSITLSLASLGYVHVPGPPVEAVIALSIVFLAREILRTIDGEATLTSRRPWLVAFTFGLLHGLGFAGALAEIGLPQRAIPLALATFNIGVELGQLAFVGVVLVAIRLLALKPGWSSPARKLAPYAIGSVSTFWVLQRLVAFVA